MGKGDKEVEEQDFLRGGGGTVFRERALQFRPERFVLLQNPFIQLYPDRESHQITEEKIDPSIGAAEIDEVGFFRNDQTLVDHRKEAGTKLCQIGGSPEPQKTVIPYLLPVVKCGYGRKGFAETGFDPASDRAGHARACLSSE